MNFPLVYEYKFDIDATNPENRIEKEPITTQPGIWHRVIIPKHAPFFAEENLELFFEDGTPMVEGEHYRIHRMMGRLTAYCGRPVACMIELLQEDTTNVRVSYHTVGDTTLFDRNFLYLIQAAINDDRPAWWDNLTNKPTAFPPTLHTHSLIYEMNSFGDMVEMINDLVEFMKSGQREILDVKLDQVVSLVDWYVDLYSQMLRNFLKRHIDSYNSHGLTAEQVQLEKVDNFSTSTLAEAIRGMSDDTHLTIPGLKALMQEHGYNKDAYLETNLIPMSQFGGRNFIPPAIDGSFEGLGSESECAGICLEADGTISIITNHFDGRTNGLYYSVASGYPNNLQIDYMAYKYQHARIEADGIQPNAIVGGSNHEIIMVGKNGSNYWYVGLSKGTFDPAKHVMSRVSLANIAADMGQDVNTYNQYFNLSVHLMGNWVYFVQTDQNPYTNGDLLIGPNTTKRFYRAKLSDIALGVSVTPTRINVSYKDCDGVQHNNQPVWYWGTAKRDANGLLTRAVFDFNPPITYNNMLYRSPLTLSTPVPNKPGVFLLKFMSHFWVSYSAPPINTSFSASPELIYEFNSETGVMTLVGQTKKETIDLSKGSWSYDSATGTPVGGLVATWARQTGVVLNDGNLLVAYSDSIYQYPHGLRLVKTGANTPYEAMVKPWYIENYPQFRIFNYLEEPVSPIQNSIRSSRICYDAEGEMFNAASQRRLGSNFIFHRTVSGDYAQREGISNLLYPDIRGRPLTNAVRQTNLHLLSPMVNVSGTATVLANAGLQAGFMSFGMGHQKRVLNTAPFNKWSEAPEDTGVMLYTQHTKVVNTDGTVTVNVDREVYYPASVVNQLINQLVPAAYKSSPEIHVTIIDPRDGIAGRLGAFPVIVVITYLDYANSTKRSVIATIRPNYSALNGKRFTVTGYTLLASKEGFVQGTQQNITPTSWPFSIFSPVSGNASNAQIYIKDDGTFDIYIFTGIATAHNGNSGCTCFRGVINKSTGAFVSGGVYNDEGNIRSAKFAIPKVGICDGIRWDQSSGGAAMIAETGGQHYLVASCYPESGWVIYFQKDQDVIFNGSLYTLPSGTVDLRDIDPSPGNKTFYVYVQLAGGLPEYVVTTQKFQDTPFRIWIGKVVTNDKQILTLDRFNVFTLNGYRVSELKRGNAIPASSGSINSEGQIPWLRSSEVIPG